MDSLKSLVAIAAACFAMVLLGPASASAGHHAHGSGPPCWKKVLNDWLPDARVDGTYPVRCYQQALKHLPPDLQAYSSAASDFKRALLLATARNGGKPPSPNALIPGANKSRSSSLSSSPARTRQPGIFRRVLDWLGPSNASSVPTPLLVLAGIALLLLLAAAASFVARRLQARRLRPAPQPAPGPDRP